MLAFHRKNSRLRTAYCLFCVFAYYTLLAKSKKTNRWLQALMHKDCNNMIKYHLQAEIEKRYSQEVEQLYKTFAFRMVGIENPIGHCGILKNVVVQVKAMAPLLSSFVLSVRLTAFIKDPASNLSNMKLVAILVILYRSTH